MDLSLLEGRDPDVIVLSSEETSPLVQPIRTELCADKKEKIE